MKNKNDALRKQVENLTSTLANFTQGRDDLDFLLRGQNKSLSKSGLGFNCVEKKNWISMLINLPCIVVFLHVIFATRKAIYHINID